MRGERSNVPREARDFTERRRESEPPTIQNLQFRADFRAESALNFCRFLRNNIMILGKF